MLHFLLHPFRFIQLLTRIMRCYLELYFTSALCLTGTLFWGPYKSTCFTSLNPRHLGTSARRSGLSSPTKAKANIGNFRLCLTSVAGVSYALPMWMPYLCISRDGPGWARRRWPRLGRCSCRGPKIWTTIFDRKNLSSKKMCWNIFFQPKLLVLGRVGGYESDSMMWATATPHVKTLFDGVFFSVEELPKILSRLITVISTFSNDWR